MDQQRLIMFMRNLIYTATKKVFLILDNLKVHHGRKVAKWVSRHQDKIRLFFHDLTITPELKYRKSTDGEKKPKPYPYFAEGYA